MRQSLESIEHVCFIVFCAGESDFGRRHAEKNVRLKTKRIGGKQQLSSSIYSLLNPNIVFGATHPRVAVVF